MIAHITGAIASSQRITVSGHRYYRFLFDTIISSFLRIEELELRAVASGADLCTGGTASASQQRSGFEASKCFDDTTTTEYRSVDNTTGIWIKYDFGVGVAHTVVQYTYDRASTASYSPSGWQLQYSDDDIAWTTVNTQSGFDASYWTANPGVTTYNV